MVKFRWVRQAWGVIHEGRPEDKKNWIWPGRGQRQFKLARQGSETIQDGQARGKS